MGNNLLYFTLLLLSALQLFVSFALLNYFFPLLPLLRPLFPIGHPHLPQIIPHTVFPSYSWSSLRSCYIRFPFVFGLSHSFIRHSFYMPQTAQSFIFYVSYYIFYTYHWLINHSWQSHSLRLYLDIHPTLEDFLYHSQGRWGQCRIQRGHDTTVSQSSF